VVKRTNKDHYNQSQSKQTETNTMGSVLLVFSFDSVQYWTHRTFLLII